MKGIRAHLRKSFIGGALAVLAGGPLSAATFALTDEIQLENVSAAAEMNRQSMVQINYAARQPHFLVPLLGAESEPQAESIDGKLKIWLSTFASIEIPLAKRDNGYAGMDLPRLRWIEAKADIEIEYEMALELNDPIEFPVSAQLLWPPTDEPSTVNLEPYVVRDIDTTCGFPNDFFDFASSPSSRMGHVWASTASFQPHPFNGPSIPTLRNVTWLRMPMPHVVGYGIGNANHASTPQGPYLRYEGLSTNGDDMTVGFRQKTEVFRCRVYASGTRERLNLPSNPSLFGDGQVASFGFEPFPLIPASVPLPGGAVLLLTGMAGLAAYGQKKRKS